MPAPGAAAPAASARDPAIGSRTPAALEYGPIAAFVLGSLLVRERSSLLAGGEYDGFVLVVAAFVPLVLAASGTMWRLTGRATPVQILSLASPARARCEPVLR